MNALTIIVAMNKARLIGKGGGLPWRGPEDMRFFKNTTMGHAVIMGRRTFLEVGKPLPGRRNIMLTSLDISPPGVEIARSLTEAISRARETDPEPFVIGGGELYRAAVPLATKMLVTIVDRDAEGDTFFPEIDWSEWKEVERRRGETEGVEFFTYVRV